MTTLKPWEKGQLRDQLTHALGEDRPGVTGLRAGILVSSHFDGPGPKSYPEQKLRELRDDVEKVLRTLAHKTRMQGVEINHLRFLTLPYNKQQVFRVEGTVRDTFLFLLFSAIRQLDKPLVRPCDHCATLFRVEHKRQYCSRELVGMPIRPPAPVGQPVQAAVLVTGIDLVPGLAGKRVTET